jgi:ABC-type Mn2+/Zn2+ transport system permease subunit
MSFIFTIVFFVWTMLNLHVFLEKVVSKKEEVTLGMVFSSFFSWIGLSISVQVSIRNMLELSLQ